ncbi:MAG TPA: TlpA disulfide reductase family protein [Candidatus Polarisedimenticolaceae bacterium]|nr:TlpA disulfide reductase family protein [Candidatus Polarisedimenticolaceae bacterium]
MSPTRISILVLAAAVILSACGGAPPPPAAAAASGKMAPEFELRDLDGKPFQLSATKGSVRLVDFWTTWCAPCREEIPMFKELHAAYGGKGFTLIGIAMDDEGVDAVKPFAEKNAIPYTTLIGSEDVATSFGGVVGYPTKFLIDRDGKIVETWVGPVPKTILEKHIRALL